MTLDINQQGINRIPCFLDILGKGIPEVCFCGNKVLNFSCSSIHILLALSSYFKHSPGQCFEGT